MRRFITSIQVLAVLGVIFASISLPQFMQSQEQSASGSECNDCKSKDKRLYAAEIVTADSPSDVAMAKSSDDESITNTKKIRIINLGPVVNYKGLDYAPTISADGRTLFFVSDRPESKISSDGTYSHDFWYATKENSLDTVFNRPFNLDTTTDAGNRGVNTDESEGAASIAADKQSLYFTACERPDGLGQCDIYYTEIDGVKWGRPINLGPNVNSLYWDSQPSIKYNKGRLYFASNRPGPNGAENRDIWYCDWDWDNDEWKPAVNLEEINTDGVDWSPFIGTDGVTLFFSSDGYSDSYGGQDFYVTTLDEATNTWSKPKNLGEPINTKNDESFITLPASGDVIYFSSKRTDLPDYQGNYDIFMAFVPSFYRTTNLRVQVVDECSRENLPADIQIVNRITGRTEKGNVSLDKKEYSIIVVNSDFGPEKDSMPFVDMMITASNPKYGSKEEIQRIMKPEKTTDEEVTKVPLEYTVTVTLGQKPKLTAKIAEADYVSRNKAKKPELAKFKGLVMEEVQTYDLYPLLNYIFFDEGSSTLPPRYQVFKSADQTRGFTDTTIAGGTLDKYYHIMNIYGYRLTKFPNEKLEIIGCIDGVSPKEKSTELSKARATLVYNYLRDIWGISEDRLKLTINKKPNRPSNEKDSLGIQENRRVELICSQWEIEKPVFTKDAKTFPQPEEMTFVIDNGIEQQLVAKRRIEIKHGDQTWKVLDDIGLTDKERIWDWLNTDDKYPKDQVPFTCQLFITTLSGAECNSEPITIPVMQISSASKRLEKSSDSTLENYSLILFPFNSADAGPKNDRIMNDYVYSRIDSTSVIAVTGHTDVVGLDERNLELSQQRAGTVQTGIDKKTTGKYGKLSVRGVGEGEPLYDNSLPEGRFYNRTVNVIIRTPIKTEE